jgi:hypothetical protein
MKKNNENHQSEHIISCYVSFAIIIKHFLCECVDIDEVMFFSYFDFEFVRNAKHNYTNKNKTNLI